MKKTWLHTRGGIYPSVKKRYISMGSRSKSRSSRFSVPSSELWVSCRDPCGCSSGSGMISSWPFAAYITTTTTSGKWKSKWARKKRMTTSCARHWRTTRSCRYRTGGSRKKGARERGGAVVQRCRYYWGKKNSTGLTTICSGKNIGYYLEEASQRRRASTRGCRRIRRHQEAMKHE